MRFFQRKSKSRAGLRASSLFVQTYLDVTSNADLRQGMNTRRQFPERPLLEETVGVGVDLAQQQVYPRIPAPPPDDEQLPSTAGGDASEPDTNFEDGAATLDFPEHLRARGAVFRRRTRATYDTVRQLESTEDEY